MPRARLAAHAVFVALCQAAIAQPCAPEWAPVGSGTSGGPSYPAVLSLTAYRGDLYAGGNFTHAGGAEVNHIARWDGAAWHAVGGGLANGMVLTSVYAAAAFDLGDGPVLVVGGDFRSAGGVPVLHLAAWNGTSWSDIGGGVSWEGGFAASVRALAVYDDGSGPALYAAGSFTHAGGVRVNHSAKWDGSAWSSLDGGADESIYALHVHNDGSGPALYAGGNLSTVGGADASFIARWNGGSWSPVGGGVNATVKTLATYDDGSGPALYAGGFFDRAGGNPAACVAKWNGSGWSSLGSGLTSTLPFPGAEALATFDDGRGLALYATGQFLFAGGQSANNIARWDGEAWEPLGSGLGEGDVAASGYALAPRFRDGIPALFAGGVFTSAGPHEALYIAGWRGCPWCPADMDADGELTLNDFLAFRDLYVVGDPRADFDGSGTLTLNDFVQFRNAYVAGCP